MNDELEIDGLSEPGDGSGAGSGSQRELAGAARASYKASLRAKIERDYQRYTPDTEDDGTDAAEYGATTEQDRADGGPDGALVLEFPAGTPGAYDGSRVDERDDSRERAGQKRANSNKRGAGGTAQKAKGLVALDEKPRRGRKPAAEKAPEKPAEPVKKPFNPFPFIKLALIFDEVEALRKQKALQEALPDYFSYLDEALNAVNKSAQEVVIWGDIDEEEAEKLARIFTRAATRSAVAATMVNLLLDWKDYADAGIIIIPRSVQTLQILTVGRKQII